MFYGTNIIPQNILGYSPHSIMNLNNILLCTNDVSMVDLFEVAIMFFGAKKCRFIHKREYVCEINAYSEPQPKPEGECQSQFQWRGEPRIVCGCVDGVEEFRVCSTCRQILEALSLCHAMSLHKCSTNSCRPPPSHEHMEFAVCCDVRRVECLGRFLGVISRGPTVSKSNRLNDWYVLVFLHYFEVYSLNYHYIR